MFQSRELHQIGIVVQAQNSLTVALFQMRQRDVVLSTQTLLEAHYTAVAYVVHAGQNDGNIELQSTLPAFYDVVFSCYRVLLRESSRLV